MRKNVIKPTMPESRKLSHKLKKQRKIVRKKHKKGKRPKRKLGKQDKIKAKLNTING